MDRQHRRSPGCGDRGLRRPVAARRTARRGFRPAPAVPGRLRQGGRRPRRRGHARAAVADARPQLVRSGTLDDLALKLAASLRDRLAERIETDPDALAEPLARLLVDLTARLRTDPEARTALDARIAATAARLVGDLRPVLGGYVADVIAGWEPDELIARFEAELGPDLQYIRVNGAVLGALIGGLLYGIGVALG